MEKLFSECNPLDMNPQFRKQPPKICLEISRSFSSSISIQMLYFIVCVFVCERMEFLQFCLPFITYFLNLGKLFVLSLR